MSIKQSKRIKAIQAKADFEKTYTLSEALKLLKGCATAKFDESIDIAIKLGVDIKKAETVRGATLLPNGTGKTIRLAVFAQGENAEIARKAGADIVGFEDLAEKIKAKQIDFDILVATPDAMRIISPLGTILGPRGLMPNPKTGTISPNIQEAVKNVKNQVSYRTDKNGIVHCSFGKASFSEEQLQKNLEVLFADLKKLRPVSSKGVYFKKISISSSMGPGINVDLISIAA